MLNKYSRNILYILPSKDWGTKERFAFKDLVIAKSYGYNVYLCTYEGSFLADAATLLEIQIIPFKEHFLNKFSSFHKHISLAPIYKIMNIDIVHCYDFQLLFSLSIQLRAEKMTALLMTQNQITDKFLQRFWLRPLISRIDSLVIMNKNLLSDVLGNFALPLKRIEYFGMGLKQEVLADPLKIAINFDLYKDYFLAGTYISPYTKETESLVTLLSALKVLNEKKEVLKKSKLVFISVVEFQSLSILLEVMKLIQELELQEDVLFVTTQDILGVIKHLNVWISHGPKELIEDLALMAIIQEVPAIFTRNFCTKGFIEDYKGVGEIYKFSDARELRDKWEKIMLGHSLFVEKTRLYKYFIEREHALKSYRLQLLNLYTRTVQRRARLFRKR